MGTYVRTPGVASPTGTYVRTPGVASPADTLVKTQGVPAGTGSIAAPGTDEYEAYHKRATSTTTVKTSEAEKTGKEPAKLAPSVPVRELPSTFTPKLTAPKAPEVPEGYAEIPGTSWYGPSQKVEVEQTAGVPSSEGQAAELTAEAMNEMVEAAIALAEANEALAAAANSLTQANQDFYQGKITQAELDAAKAVKDEAVAAQKAAEATYYEAAAVTGKIEVHFTAGGGYEVSSLPSVGDVVQYGTGGEGTVTGIYTDPITGQITVSLNGGEAEYYFVQEGDKFIRTDFSGASAEASGEGRPATYLTSQKQVDLVNSILEEFNASGGNLKDAIIGGMSDAELGVLGFTDAQLKVGHIEARLGDVGSALELGQVSSADLLRAGYPMASVNVYLYQQKALNALAPFKSTSEESLAGMTPEERFEAQKNPSYDIPAAIKAGVSEEYLGLLFGVQTIADMRSVLSYFDENGNFGLAQAINDKVSNDVLTRLFGEEAISSTKAAIARQGSDVQTLSSYLTSESAKKVYEFEARRDKARAGGDTAMANWYQRIINENTNYDTLAIAAAVINGTLSTDVVSRLFGQGFIDNYVPAVRELQVAADKLNVSLKDLTPQDALDTLQVSAGTIDAVWGKGAAVAALAFCNANQKLVDGTWMEKATLSGMSNSNPDAYSYLMKNGYNDYIALQDEVLAQVAMAVLPDGKEGRDLVGAIGEVDEAKLRVVFGGAAVDAAIAFNDKYTLLPGDTYMDKAVLAEIERANKVGYDILMTQGFGEFIDAQAQAKQLLEPYKSHYVSEEYEPTYNLVDAVGTVDDKSLRVLFGDIAVDTAIETKTGAVQVRDQAAIDAGVMQIDKSLHALMSGEKVPIVNAMISLGILERDAWGLNVIDPLTSKMADSTTVWERLTDKEKQAVAAEYLGMPRGYTAFTKEFETAMTTITQGAVSTPTVASLDKWASSSEGAEIAMDVFRAVIPPLGVVTDKRDMLRAAVVRSELASPTEVAGSKLNKFWATLSDEDKQKVLANYTTPLGVAAGAITGWQGAIDKTLQGWQEDIAKGGENAATWLKSMSTSILQTVADTTLGMTSLGLGAINSVSQGKITPAAFAALVIPASMVYWAVSQPSEISKSPFYGTASLVGNLAGFAALPLVTNVVKTVTWTGPRWTLAEIEILAKGQTGQARAMTLTKWGIKRVPTPAEILEADLSKVAVERPDLVEQLKRMPVEKQITAMREILNPESFKIWEAGYNYAKLVGDVKLPNQMMRATLEVFEGVEAFKGSKAAAKVLDDFFRANSKSARIVGSTSEYLAKLVKDTPGDIDVDVLGGKSISVLASELAARLQRAGVGGVVAEGGKVKIGSVKAVEFHKLGQFGGMLYGFKEGPPVFVDGIQFRSFGSQFLTRADSVLMPGRAERAGQLYPKHEGRLPKDVERWWSDLEIIHEILKTTNDPRLAQANVLADNFKAVAPKGGSFEAGEPLTPEQIAALKKAGYTEQEFLEIMGRAAKLANERGEIIVLKDPKITLIARPTPMAKGGVTGVYYHITTLKDLGMTFDEFVKTGIIDTEGKTLFASEEAAFDYIRAKYGGELPKDTILIAVRTVPGEVRVAERGQGITTTPRTETRYDAKGKPITEALNEVWIEDTKLYKTPANELSIERGITKGVTGETVAFDPRTYQRIPTLWVDTAAALKAGLRAPDTAIMRSVALLTVRDSLIDLVHPHRPKLEFVSEGPAINLGLGDWFYQDSVSWKYPSRVSAAADWLMARAREIWKNERGEISMGEAVRRAEEDTLLGMLKKFAEDPEALARLKKTTVEHREAVIKVNLTRLLEETLAAGLSGLAAPDAALQTSPLGASSSVVVSAPSAVVATPVTAVEVFTVPVSSVAPTSLPAVGLTDILEDSLPPVGTLAPSETEVSVTELSVPDITVPEITVPEITVPSTTLGLDEAVTTTRTTKETAKTESITSALDESVTSTLEETTKTATPTLTEMTTTPATTPITEVSTTPTTTTPVTTPPTTPPPPPPPTTPPPPPPPTTPPPPPPPPEVVRLGSGGAEEKERPVIPEGSIAWRQGFVWKYIPPPYDQEKPITLGNPPAGAIRTEMHTPQETIQVIGQAGAPIPEAISIDLGVVDILITDSGRNIRYVGKGMQTDVGERIIGPEKGMSIPSQGLQEVKPMIEATETQKVEDAATPTPVSATPQVVQPLGISGLPTGTTFDEFIRIAPQSAAQKEFVEARMSELMNRMSSREIATKLDEAGVDDARRNEILSRLPDEKRLEVLRLMTERLYSRVGSGYAFAQAAPGTKPLGALTSKKLLATKKLAKVKLGALAPAGVTQVKDGYTDVTNVEIE
jgi:hypothetical protein